jgi:hypothetical protein
LGKLIDAMGSVDDYVSQRREIELLRARVVELVEALGDEADPGAQAWRRVGTDATSLVEAIEQQDSAAALNLARAIADRSARAFARDTAWRSLETSLRTLTKLCDNERRVVEALHNAVTVNDWKRLMSALTVAVFREVDDEALKRSIGETLLAFLRYQPAGSTTEDVTRRLLVTPGADEPADLTPLYRELRIEAEGLSIDRGHGINDA